jgi:hypothetical protein
MYLGQDETRTESACSPSPAPFSLISLGTLPWLDRHAWPQLPSSMHAHTRCVARVRSMDQGKYSRTIHVHTPLPQPAGSIDQCFFSTTCTFLWDFKQHDTSNGPRFFSFFFSFVRRDVRALKLCISNLYSMASSSSCLVAQLQIGHTSRSRSTSSPPTSPTLLLLPFLGKLPNISTVHDQSS